MHNFITTNLIHSICRERRYRRSGQNWRKKYKTPSWRFVSGRRSSIPDNFQSLFM